MWFKIMIKKKFIPFFICILFSNSAFAFLPSHKVASIPSHVQDFLLNRLSSYSYSNEILISKNSQVLVYPEAGSYFKNGVRVTKRSYDHVAYPVLDYDGKVFFFKARSKNKEFVVVNGREAPQFDAVFLPEGDEERSRLVGAYQNLYYVACNISQTQNIYLARSQCFVVVTDPKKDKLIPLPPFIQSPKQVDLALFPQGRHFYLRLFDSRKRENYLSIDGKLKKPFHILLSQNDPILSQDGENILYVGEWEGKQVVVLNGEQFSQYYEKIYCNKGFYSAQNKWVCLGYRGEETFLITSGAEKKIDGEMIGLPALSPDGKTLTYLIKDGEVLYSVINDRKSKIFEYKDQIKKEHTYRLYSQILDLGLKEIYYFIPTAKQQMIMISQNRMNDDLLFAQLTPYVEVSFFLNPYSAEKDFLLGVKDHKNNYFYLSKKLNAQKMGPYSFVKGPIFSKNGVSFAFEAEKDKKYFYVINGKKQSSYSQRVGAFVFSPSGHRWVYNAVTQSGKNRYESFWVQDGQKQIISDFDLYNVVNEFSPDSRHVLSWLRYQRVMTSTEGVVYLSRASHIIIDQKAPKNIDEFVLIDQDIQVNEDGSEMAFLALKNNELWWIVRKL